MPYLALLFLLTPLLCYRARCECVALCVSIGATMALIGFVGLVLAQALRRMAVQGHLARTRPITFGFERRKDL